MLKAIETVYNGYKFRSRLEARWAVFFDTLGIKYGYEYEGYDLDGLWYLPDFWLHKDGCFIEIKPSELTKQEVCKAEQLTIKSQRPCFVFTGSVGLGEHTIAACMPSIGWFIYDKLAVCTLCNSLWLVASYTDQFTHPYDCAHLEASQPVFNHPRLIAAYTAARSARFEHGVKP